MDNYRHSIDNGVLKVMPKVGISTLQSYKGAQIFEAFELFAVDVFELYERGWPSRETITAPGMVSRMLFERRTRPPSTPAERIQTIKPVPSISAVSSSSGTRMLPQAR